MADNKDFKEYPKMLYHEQKGQKIVKSAEEEAKAGSGWSTKAPAQFPSEEEEESPIDQGDNGELGAATSGIPDPNEDPTREPAIVSQIEQEKTRVAGNQGAKDPATMPAKKGSK